MAQPGRTAREAAPIAAGVAHASDGNSLELFAATAPGLEPLAAAELRALGAARASVEPGGVAFAGTLDTVYRANLWLRTASRVIARVGAFGARHFAALERHAERQPWERFLGPDARVRLRVTCRKSKLYHSDAVAERIARSIERRLGRKPAFDAAAGADDADVDEPPSEAQLIVARIVHDSCTLSVDTSGALLHLRGYRQATARAPLRETLAAAMLLGVEWVAEAPLVDPMCGAGTIAIEAALLARRIAPGAGRGFAFERWPGFDRARWDALLSDARAGELPSAPAPIVASDRDAGAIEAASANAARAGVAADVELARVALSAARSPGGRGWLVTNPPYGVRVGDRDRLRNLYAQLGNVARRSFAGWTIGLLSAEPTLDRQLGISLAEVFRTRNGGIPVRLLRGTSTA